MRSDKDEVLIKALFNHPQSIAASNAVHKTNSPQQIAHNQRQKRICDELFNHPTSPKYKIPEER